MGLGFGANGDGAGISHWAGTLGSRVFVRTWSASTHVLLLLACATARGVGRPAIGKHRDLTLPCLLLAAGDWERAYRRQTWEYVAQPPLLAAPRRNEQGANGEE